MKMGALKARRYRSPRAPSPPLCRVYAQAIIAGPPPPRDLAAHSVANAKAQHDVVPSPGIDDRLALLVVQADIDLVPSPPRIPTCSCGAPRSAPASVGPAHRRRSGLPPPTRICIASVVQDRLHPVEARTAIDIRPPHSDPLVAGYTIRIQTKIVRTSAHPIGARQSLSLVSMTSVPPRPTITSSSGVPDTTSSAAVPTIGRGHPKAHRPAGLAAPAARGLPPARRRPCRHQHQSWRPRSPDGLARRMDCASTPRPFERREGAIRPTPLPSGQIRGEPHGPRTVSVRAPAHSRLKALRLQRGPSCSAMTAQRACEA